jgi:cytochrome c oxidase subunit 3
MVATVLLGLAFSGLQGIEYHEAPFSMWDSVFRSTFFMSTGFHGLHVLIGTTFLVTVTIRLAYAKLSREHLVGFECAAWYWHFVDVVWLFLYSLVYWWGSLNVK